MTITAPHRWTRLELPLLAVLFLASCTQGGGPDFGPVSSATTATAGPVSPGATATKRVQLTYHVGPFDLAAGTAPAKMREKPGTIRFHVDEPIWVTSFEPKIEDGEGRQLPGSLLHLAVVSNLAEANPLCTTKHTGNPFAAAASSMKKISLPDGHGYAVLPEDAIEASVVLRNPSNQDYHDVYFIFTLVGEPLNTGKAMVDVAPLLLDVDPCGHEPLAVEPKGYLRKTQRFLMPESGHLILAYGLLQDYGVEIALGKESETTPFWKAAATINSDHQIVSLPNFEDPAGVQMHSGDAIVLDVAYDNFQEEWYNDATAAAIAYVARTGDTSTSPTTSKPTRKRAEPAVSVQALLLK